MKRSSALIWLAAAMLAVLPAMADAQIVAGQAVAIDGDSLDMTDTRIRLFGIDAPEKRQTCQRGAEAWSCGTEAGRYLRELVSGGQTECRGIEHDVYGRLVATCRTRSFDVGLAMLEAGLATALSNASPEYRDAEARARANKVGIWGTAFETPAAWRAAHPRDDASAGQALGRVRTPAPRAEAGRSHRNAFGCAIKGNRSQRGDWIYHLPGSRYYVTTRPEELFCTEQQAVAAGYRRSRAD